MRTPRRFAAPALALLLALGASGCAGLSFNTGCGLASLDPMTDGAARMNRGVGLHQMRSQQQAYQHKALMIGAEFNRGAIRKPGSLPLTQTAAPSAFCYR
jgi:hypothetical protein